MKLRKSVRLSFPDIMHTTLRYYCVSSREAIRFGIEVRTSVCLNCLKIIAND